MTDKLSIYSPYDANFAALLGGNAGNWLHRLRVGPPRLETPLACWGFVGNMGLCETGYIYISAYIYILTFFPFSLLITGKLLGLQGFDFCTEFGVLGHFRVQGNQFGVRVSRV